MPPRYRRLLLGPLAALLATLAVAGPGWLGGVGLQQAPFRDHYRGFLRLARRHAAQRVADDSHAGPSPFPAASPREIAGRRKDGTVFPMELAVSLVPLGDRVLLTGIARDATGRKQLETE